VDLNGFHAFNLLTIICTWTNDIKTKSWMNSTIILQLLIVSTSFLFIHLWSMDYSWLLSCSLLSIFVLSFWKQCRFIYHNDRCYFYYLEVLLYLSSLTCIIVVTIAITPTATIAITILLLSLVLLLVTMTTTSLFRLLLLVLLLLLF